MSIWIREPGEPFMQHVRVTLHDVDREGRISVKDWDQCCPLCGEPLNKTKRWYHCKNPSCPLTYLGYNGKWIYNLVLAVTDASLKG